MKFVVAAILATTNAALNPNQIKQVTEGFVGSALHYEKLDGYKACYLDDNVKPVDNIEQGMADLDKAIENKDISGVYKAAQELKAGFATILIDQKDCVAKTGDAAHAAKIETYMKQYESMDALYSHVESDLAWNGISIAMKLSDAKTQYAAGKFEAYGSDYGIIVDEVLIGTNKISAQKVILGAEGHGQQKVILGAEGHGQYKAVNVKEVAEVVTGILVGALKAEGLDSIENCIKDSELVFSDIKDGIALLKKEDAADALAGLKKIGAGVVEIKTAVADCKGITADFAKLEKMAAVYSNPWSFAYHVGKDLVVNGVTIFKDTEDSITQYEAGKFEAMGEDIGDALAKLLLGGALEVQENWRVQEANNFKNLSLF